MSPDTDARPTVSDEALDLLFRRARTHRAWLDRPVPAAGMRTNFDCGAMSGFDNAKVDAAFFPDGRVKSNFLCNLGYGDASKLGPRPPRLPFDDACRII